MTLWALAALGGAAGAVARYAVDRAAAQWLGATLLGTFAVNISGLVSAGDARGAGGTGALGCRLRRGRSRRWDFWDRTRLSPR